MTHLFSLEDVSSVREGAFLGKLGGKALIRDLERNDNITTTMKQQIIHLSTKFANILHLTLPIRVYLTNKLMYMLLGICWHPNSLPSLRWKKERKPPEVPCKYAKFPPRLANNPST